MLKPPRLRAGDTVAAVSLSWGGPSVSPLRYETGKRQLEEAFGVRVVETQHALADAAWLAEHPEARAADLMAAFADPEIRGVISTIGGDDSVRILRHLDLDVIRANPKVFMGYSDTTVSHFACFAAGLTSFYGPAIMAGFGENGGLFDYLADSVRRTLFEAEPVGVVAPNPGGWTVEWRDWDDPEAQARPRDLTPSTGWRWLQGEGVVRGPLIGGCVEVMAWLPATPVWPSPDAFDGAILFLETSEEAPPPRDVRRWLRMFGAQGVLDGVGAVLFGRPGGHELPRVEDEAYDAVILEVVRELGLDVPVVTGMDFGHTDPFFVLPYGVTAEVDCEAGMLAIVEPAVT